MQFGMRVLYNFLVILCLLGFTQCKKELEPYELIPEEIPELPDTLMAVFTWTHTTFTHRVLTRRDDQSSYVVKQMSVSGFVLHKDGVVIDTLHRRQYDPYYHQAPSVSDGHLVVREFPYRAYNDWGTYSTKNHFYKSVPTPQKDTFSYGGTYIGGVWQRNLDGTDSSYKSTLTINVDTTQFPAVVSLVPEYPGWGYNFGLRGDYVLESIDRSNYPIDTSQHGGDYIRLKEDTLFVSRCYACGLKSYPTSEYYIMFYGLKEE
ncbi:MAG: hypothetical protein RLP15_10825 [Cryomorphaceae bacterium]